MIVTAFEEHPFHIAGLVLELALRAGVAIFPDHADDATQLLKRAEIALRTARTHHSPASSFVAGDDPARPRQLVLADELRRGIENEEFHVYVQPQYDMRTGSAARVEVLVRWLRDGEMYLRPDEFIPVAERTGLIRPLTRYMLARALEHRRQWAAAGYDVDVCINASVRDLVDPAFPEQVAVALTRAGCPARALTVEITETQMMSDADRVAAAVRRLALLGVEVSIDDFGTGYSSLSVVRALAINELKIDKSFVMHAADDEQDASLVRSVNALGHGLGLRVVAEGVEDERCLELLRDAGVDFAQGYHIARPMPALELPGWLAARDELAVVDQPG